MSLRSATLVALLAAQPLTAAALELVANGGFETPTVPLLGGSVGFNNDQTLGNWTNPGVRSASYVVGAYHIYPPAHAGTQLMLLENADGTASGIFQNVTLEAGTNYQLRFALRGVSPEFGFPAVVGAQVALQDFAVALGAPGTAWASYSYTFTATGSGSEALWFKPAETTSLLAIDSVSLQALPVPEAPALLLWLSGVALLAPALRRRRGTARA